MKKNLFLKELGMALIIKVIFLWIIWWNFFSHPKSLNPARFADKVFGEGIRHD